MPQPRATSLGMLLAPRRIRNSRTSSQRKAHTSGLSTTAFMLHPHLKATGIRLCLRTFTLGAAEKKGFVCLRGKASRSHVCSQVSSCSHHAGSPWQSNALLLGALCCLSDVNGEWQLLLKPEAVWVVGSRGGKIRRGSREHGKEGVGVSAALS